MILIWLSLTDTSVFFVFRDPKELKDMQETSGIPESEEIL
jgi:hypothetical protein